MTETRRRQNVEQFKRILESDQLSDYTLGALMGFEISVDEQDNAEEVAMDILQV